MDKEDNKVYRKVGRRYEPVGMFTGCDWLGDGIWYLNSKPGCRSTISVEYLSNLLKVGDKSIPDLTKLCGLKDIVDEVMDHEVIQKVWSEPHSLADVVYKVVGVVSEIAEKQYIDKNYLNKSITDSNLINNGFTREYNKYTKTYYFKKRIGWYDYLLEEVGNRYWKYIIMSDTPDGSGCESHGSIKYMQQLDKLTKIYY